MEAQLAPALDVSCGPCLRAHSHSSRLPCCRAGVAPHACVPCIKSPTSQPRHHMLPYCRPSETHPLLWPTSPMACPQREKQLMMEGSQDAAAFACWEACSGANVAVAGRGWDARRCQAPPAAPACRLGGMYQNVYYPYKAGCHCSCGDEEGLLHRREITPNPSPLQARCAPASCCLQGVCRHQRGRGSVLALTACPSFHHNAVAPGTAPALLAVFRLFSTPRCLLRCLPTVACQLTPPQHWATAFAARRRSPPCAPAPPASATRAAPAAPIPPHRCCCQMPTSGTGPAPAAACSTAQPAHAAVRAAPHVS